MSVSPASFSNGVTFSPELYSVDDADDADAAGGLDAATGASADEATSAQGVAPAADALPSSSTTAGGLTSMIAGIEQQFSVMLKRFGQELAGLESRVSSFFRSFAPGPRLPLAPVAQGPSAPTRSTHVSPYDGLIKRAAQRYEVDPELVGAVIREESGFREAARSPAGAMGLMQLMPETARDLGVSNPFDAEQNVEAGTRFLRSLIDRYGGRVDLALAAYNAGPGAVDKYHGIPPYAQTQGYVRDIMTSYRAAVLER